MPELALECIGDDIAQAMKRFHQLERRLTPASGGHVWERLFRASRSDTWPEPWLAEVTGIRTDGRFVLQFQRGRKDYTRANGPGSRGVYLWFTLIEDHVYWIQARESWKRVRRYYVVVHAGAVIEITEEEARCRSGRLESTF